jgi:hypothetical protein
MRKASLFFRRRLPEKVKRGQGNFASEGSIRKAKRYENRKRKPFLRHPIKSRVQGHGRILTILNSDRYMYHVPTHRLRSKLVIASIFLFFLGFQLPVYGKYGNGFWDFLEKDEEGIWFYYHDIDCPAPNHSIVRTKIIYNQNGVLKHIDKYGEGYLNLDHSISVWEIDCFQKKFRLIYTIFYAKDKSIIECYDDEKGKYFALEDIPAGSYIELVSEMFCGKWIRK